MRPIRVNVDLSTVDTNGVFEAQTLGGAGAVILNGAEITSGVWTALDGFAKKIGINCSADISTTTFTITGFRDSAGIIAITDTITGINNTTVESSEYFYSITSIISDAAVGTNIIGGAVDESITRTIPLNWRGGITSINLDFTGTANVTVQQTFDNVQDLNNLTYNWQNSPSASLVNATSSSNNAYEGVPTALRLVVNSYSTGAAVLMTIIQRDV